jgi:preprotein translocase SecE subunit
MARTRQKAKQRQAKRRAQQQQREVQGTTGQKLPSNPAEQAVVEQAEAYELGDTIEETSGDPGTALERIDEEDSDPAEAIKPVREKTRERAPAKPVEPPTKRSAARAERPDGRARRPRAEPRREARQRGRVVNFLIQVWAELRRVQWPDRTQVTQATGVVVVFCLLAGLYLAFFDYIFNELVKALI